MALLDISVGTYRKRYGRASVHDRRGEGDGLEGDDAAARVRKVRDFEQQHREYLLLRKPDLARKVLEAAARLIRPTPRAVSSSAKALPIRSRSRVGPTTFVAATIHGWKGPRPIYFSLLSVNGWLTTYSRPALDVLASNRSPKWVNSVGLAMSAISSLIPQQRRESGHQRNVGQGQEPTKHHVVVRRSVDATRLPPIWKIPICAAPRKTAPHAQHA